MYSTLWLNNSQWCSWSKKLFTNIHCAFVNLLVLSQTSHNRQQARELEKLLHVIVTSQPVSKAYDVIAAISIVKKSIVGGESSELPLLLQRLICWMVDNRAS